MALKARPIIAVEPNLSASNVCAVNQSLLAFPRLILL